MHINFLRKFGRWSATCQAACCAIFIATMVWIDYTTRHGAKVSLFYLLPISWLTWQYGRVVGLGVAAICATSWLVLDLIIGQEYSLPVYVWNTAIIFGFFGVVVLLLVALKQSLTTAHDLAHTDYLTGAVNLRLFELLLQMEIDRYHRFQQPFILAYLDVDDFKQINDRCGHQAGDQVLKTLVTQAKCCLRLTDTIARIGGDEFCLLLPNTTQAVAESLLLRFLACYYRQLPACVMTSVSVGVLVCQDLTRDANNFLLRKQADAVLYAVKSNTKNAIHFAKFMPEPPASP